ncbi:MAG: hypothetical protein A2Z12_03965 [Actinobacteria bacterium RBG_16_68_21]|nr:MAG: hypothetical protein A2Z12_03965 [Actinobacteria bacterium RBG_16_68_21]
MSAWICATCGHQHADTPVPPPACRICTDPRQWVRWEGQEWTTLEELRGEGHTVEIRPIEAGLIGLAIAPSRFIGQRALIVITPAGNVMWDCFGFIDATAVAAVTAIGGLAAVSASHPHFYGAMVEWARAFDAPIHLPEADARWVMRPDPSIAFYRDSAEPLPGVRLIRCGGHFPGSAVLHWPEGAAGRGVLLTGDTFTVVRDRSWVSVMWSYPNLIPLDTATVRRVGGAVAGLGFDRLYGGWWDSVIDHDATNAVARSIDRLAVMLSGAHDLEM